MLKNITISAEETLIARARERARGEDLSLNAVVRHWLARYVGQDKAGGEFRHLMKELADVEAGRRFTRDELNER